MNNHADDTADRSSSRLRTALMVLAPLPALVVGVLVMRLHGVGSGVWGQQLAVGLTLAGLCACIALVWRIRLPSSSLWWPLTGSVALLLLAATLAHPGLDGVHRWIALGPLQLHAAFVALPMLLVAIGGIARANAFGGAGWIVPFTAAAVAVVLVVQPDAAQASAFAVAAGVLVARRKPVHAAGWIGAAIVVAAAAVAWTRPDPLASVPYVEGIVRLAASLGTVWLVASLIALGLLPVPFIVEAVRSRKHAPENLALAAYFAVVCSAPFLGAFPVPLLGYGLSPILGYFAVLIWVMSAST